MNLEQLILNRVEENERNKDTEEFDFLSLNIEDILEVLNEHNDNVPVFVYRADKGLLVGIKNSYDTYRGDYTQGALEHSDAEDTSLVHGIVEELSSALITTQEGYKGGEYTHKLSTDVYLSNYGEASNVVLHKGITVEVDNTEYPVFIATEVQD